MKSLVRDTRQLKSQFISDSNELARKLRCKYQLTNFDRNIIINSGEIRLLTPIRKQCNRNLDIKSIIYVLNST